MTDRNYQVLARKWRPQKFDQVVGQSAIVRTLSNALEQGRVAHAYCFSGIRGVGKTTIARLLAKGLNCRNVEAPTADPCGECEACVEIEESRNLDVIEMDAASQTGVDDIRQLNEFARYTPSRDRYRVFIIDEAHMLSTSAFNALLKTLEEPPPHVIFMLATTEPHKILQTVLSRCQHYPLGRISQAEITARLREIVDAEKVSVSDDGLAMVAISADGSLRDAQSLLDKMIAFGGDEIDDETVADLLGMVDRELLFGAGELIAGQDLAGVLGFVNRMVEQGIDLHQFTLDLLGHFRALLVAATVDDPGEILHLPDADIERLQKQAELFEVEDLDRSFTLLSASEYRIKQSEVPRYQLEIVLSRLARMPKLEPIESLIRQLQSGSSSSSGGGSGVGGGDTGRRSSGRGGMSAAAPASSSRAAPAPGPASAPGPAARPPRESAVPPTFEPSARPPAPPSRPVAEPRAPTPPPTPQSAAAAPTGAAAPSFAENVAPSLAEPAAPTNGDAPPAAAPHTGPEVLPPEPTEAVAAVLGFGPDIGLIHERLQRDKPMIAKIVERASMAELRDDTLFLTFAQAGGIFQTRLRDRSALASIEDAGEAALGRKIKVVAGFDDGAETAEEPDPTTASEAAAPGNHPGRQAEQRRDDLWNRAEAEPMVQQFIDALRGNLTDVEEI